MYFVPKYVFRVLVLVLEPQTHVGPYWYCYTTQFCTVKLPASVCSDITQPSSVEEISNRLREEEVQSQGLLGLYVYLQAKRLAIYTDNVRISSILTLLTN